MKLGQSQMEKGTAKKFGPHLQALEVWGGECQLLRKAWPLSCFTLAMFHSGVGEEGKKSRYI